MLTAAALWGVASSLTTIVFTSMFFLAGANHEPIRRLSQELVDLLPMSFGLGGTAGALFALLVIIAEQRQTLAGLSEQRFRLWGILAGALPMAVVEGVTRLGPHHASLPSGLYAILCGGFTGAYFAPAILRAARRSHADSGSQYSDTRSPVI